MSHSLACLTGVSCAEQVPGIQMVDRMNVLHHTSSSQYPCRSPKTIFGTTQVKEILVQVAKGQFLK